LERKCGIELHENYFSVIGYGELRKIKIRDNPYDAIAMGQTSYI
jgi:hypothetical protein